MGRRQWCEVDGNIWSRLRIESEEKLLEPDDGHGNSKETLAWDAFMLFKEDCSDGG